MPTQTLTKIITATTRPSSKGQVVIPKIIRDLMAINQETPLIFKFNPTEKEVTFRKQEDDIYSVFGSLGKKLKNSKKITQAEFKSGLEKSKTAKFKDND